ncbi:MAG TPA: hypothetical protein VJI96_01510 [Candidatus Andersenbacteria bacterium]|nr:hypothetical protein [Candidatus Andersenbacteria bacterium]
MNIKLIPEALAQGLVPAPVLEGTARSGLIPAVLNIVNGLLVVASIAAAIYLVLGGIRYITSQGEEDQTEQAKSTILYALIGLIVIGLSAALVNFIVGTVAVA